MKQANLAHYANFLRETSLLLLTQKTLPEELLLHESDNYSTFYAPFEHLNSEAKVVIVGITPGLQQASNALLKAREVLLEGKSTSEAAAQAKVFASFSGAMRNNLVAMLDYVGLNNYLELRSTASLFNENSNMAHFTSALRNPVFKAGKNFNDNPMLLREQVMAWFAEECRELDSAVFIPLGPKVNIVLEAMLQEEVLKPQQVLSGLPHPSGANAERISYFLDKKDKQALSNKTNPNLIDEAKQLVMEKVFSL